MATAKPSGAPDVGVGDASTAAEKGPCATPMDLLAQRNKGMHSDKSVAHGTSFRPRPSDVFITTYPKCGTTWVTQICHMLRSGGDMDFGEISMVCPWDIMALDCGQDLDMDHKYNPRVFKSHEKPGNIAKGGKYIHVCRNPEDVFVSFHRFLPGFMGIPPGAITVDEFAAAVFGGMSHSGGIWDFFVDWWARRGDADVLWVCYEELLDDLPRQVRRIAAFMGVALDDKLLEVTLERSSFAYMAARTTQFDEHFAFEKVRDQMGIPADYRFGDVESSKVRKDGGTAGEGKKGLPDSVQEMLRSRWAETVEAKLGFKSYAELRAAVGQLP